MKDLSKQRLFYIKCHIMQFSWLEMQETGGNMCKELHMNGALLVSMVTNIKNTFLENGQAKSVRCKFMSTKTKEPIQSYGM